MRLWKWTTLPVAVLQSMLLSAQTIDVVSDREEVVFDFPGASCTPTAVPDMDFPDMPARAVRIGSEVHLYITNNETRRAVGSSLDKVTRDCDVVFKSHHRDEPWLFDDAEWLNAPYILPTGLMFALVHNEYLGWQHGNKYCGPTIRPFERCYFAVQTHAVSIDHGRTWTHPVVAPNHLIASPPYRYIPDQPAQGYRGASNILKAGDYFYVAFWAQPLAGQAQKPGTCIMRTPNLLEPAAWRAWGGKAKGWEVELINPYTNDPFEPADYVCEPLSSAPGVATSLTWNSYLNKFMLAGIGLGHGLARGIHFVLSDDLVNWSPRHLLREQPIVGKWAPPERPTNYPSILDPDSPSDNFDVAGSNPYLYYVRRGGHPDDDLMRARIELRAGCQNSNSGVYDVLRTQNGADHSVEFPGNCRPSGYRVTEPVFKASGTWGGGTRALFLCEAQRTPPDFFVDLSPDCGAQSYVSRIGYVYTSGPDRHAIYRCRVTGEGEYFVSRDRECEGQTFDTILGYSFELQSPVSDSATR